MTIKILTLGFDETDIETINQDGEKILFKVETLSEFESTLNRVDEIDTILLDSHFLTSPKTELRTILGLTSPTTQIVLHYYEGDELDLDNLRQLGIELLLAPLSPDGWLALTERD